jgi:molybdate transport system regulatory protein
VEARLGGSGGGGAKVTELGQEALRRYRDLQDLAWVTVRKAVHDFQHLLQPART